MSVTVIIFVFAAAMALLLLSLRTLAVTGVPVVHMNEEVVGTALDMLCLRDGERFVDLGCGAGNVLLAARRKADVLAMGLELNPAVALVALFRTLGDKRARVRARDIRKADLGSPDAVYAFLIPRAMAQLASPLTAQLREGARIVSVDFEIPGWRAAEVRECKGAHAIYLYVIGEHLE